MIALLDCGGSARDRRGELPSSGAAGTAVGPGTAGSADSDAEAGGIGGISNAGAAGGGDLDDAGAFARWEQELALARCQRGARCGQSPFVEACVELWNYAPYVRFYGGADYYADLSNLYELADEPTRAACLAGITTLQCNESEAEVSACSHLWIARSPRQEGEGCGRANPYLKQHPCDAGLRCDRVDDCWVCVVAGEPTPPGGLGDPCYIADCAADLHCEWDPTAQATTCQPDPAPARLGEICQSEYGCQGLAACELESAGCLESGSACTLRCVPQVGEGEACGLGSGSACLDGFYCVRMPGSDQGVCREPAVAGTPCDDSGLSAPCALWCVHQAADATTGICGLPPTSGPCSSGGCPAGTYRDSGADDPSAPYCNCLPVRAIDAPCTSHVECGGEQALQTANRCIGSPGSKRCAPALAGGAKCTDDSECLSWTCDARRKNCDPAVSCATDD